MAARHKAEVRFSDRRKEQYRTLPSDYARARHRKLGPPAAPTLFDMTSSELTAAKGAGPIY